MPNEFNQEFTSVVNFRPEEPDWTLGELWRHRFISKKPLYNLTALQTAFSSQDVLLVTKDCRKDVEEVLQSDADDVWRAVQGLKAGNYVNSQWCSTSGRSWVPCDAYVVEIWPVKVDGDTIRDLYLKFGMSKTGKCLLVISCHPSGDEDENA